jgi:hypothetical protein
MAVVTHHPKKFFIDEHPATNVVISLFTTASARLKLLAAMEKVIENPRCQILYTDT